MDSTLTKKPTPISFAAVAGKIPSPVAAAPAASSSVTPGPGSAAKNGATTTTTTQPSPTPAPQSPAPASTSAADTTATTTTATTTTTTTSGVSSTKASASTSTSSGSIDWIIGLNVRVVTLAAEVFEGQVYTYDTIMNCLCLSSKQVSASSTPSAASYYSPSLGNSSNNAARLKYDFRILKINYIKDVTPLPSGSSNTSTANSPDPSAAAAVAASASASGDKDAKEQQDKNSSITNNVYATALPAVGPVQLDKLQQREQQAIREAQVAAARIGVGVSSIGQDIFDALSKTLPCRWAKDSIVVMDEVLIAPPYEPENCKASASSSYTLARVKKVLEHERMRLANGRK
ncbi:hypothetical protein BGZ99_009101 [Dissophora globulifera]|uniref:AD domain-containing protein n=1 Tax=Dissophora globulifera TaxID=979702 RepID=A0A9P6R5F2_9FUNG|nr:hypothetical protein BGZ99_009101 [Dissophora globulifera]